MLCDGGIAAVLQGVASPERRVELFAAYVGVEFVCQLSSPDRNVSVVLFVAGRCLARAAGGAVCSVC